MTCLRLVLGDQLDPGHPWFANVRPDVAYVLMEIRQETDYVLHHAQKIIARRQGLAIGAPTRPIGERHGVPRRPILC